jgi:tripartite-type tricarboxylate transporter receptor subunit TctC
MELPRHVAWTICIELLIVHAGPAIAQPASTGSGQPYPNKLIRIYTAEPGASTDFSARLIAQNLASKLGQPVVVENRGGASGTIAVQSTAKGSPDGYTLLFYTDSLWLAPFLRNDVPYDPVRDFATITIAAISPNILVVHPSLPVKSVKELIALAKLKPGELSYATGSTASSNHLAAELFKLTAGINMVRIPYKGAGPALNALVGGQGELMFASTNTGWPQVKTGRLRGLAIAGLQPSALTPGLPTIASSGLPGFEAASTNAMFAPAKTPPAIVSLLNQEVVRILNQTDTKEKLSNAGLDVVGNTPDEAAAKIKSEMAKWGKLIRDIGIGAE